MPSRCHRPQPAKALVGLLLQREADEGFTLQDVVDEPDAPIPAKRLSELTDWRLAHCLRKTGLSEAEGAL